MMKQFIYFLSLFFLIGCNTPKIEKSYFIGHWKASDGGSIILNEDGTCVIKNLDYYKIYGFPEHKNKQLSSEGTWGFINNVDSGIIDGINKGITLTFKIPDRNGNGDISFYIAGQGILGNKEPWSIFLWDGDPDEMIKYEFTK